MCKGICVFLFFCSAGLFSCKYVVLQRKILQNLLVFSNDCLHNDYANTLYTWNYHASDVKLLCIFKANKILAIWPLEYDKVWQISFICKASSS